MDNRKDQCEATHACMNFRVRVRCYTLAVSSGFIPMEARAASESDLVLVCSSAGGQGS
jgi:hypothetical protein